MTAPATLTLPARLDLSTATALAGSLRDHAGADLALDAAGLTHLGTPGLQVLLAARRSWEAAGHALTIENAPATLADQLAQFGLAPDDLSTGAASPSREGRAARDAQAADGSVAAPAADGPAEAASVEAAESGAGAETGADGETIEGDRP